MIRALCLCKHVSSLLFQRDQASESHQSQRIQYHISRPLMPSFLPTLSLLLLLLFTTSSSNPFGDRPDESYGALWPSDGKDDPPPTIPHDLPPLFVVEMHHETVKYWIKAAHEGMVPKSGVTLIHFDSHPDMGVPDVAYKPGWDWDSEFSWKRVKKLEKNNNIATGCIAMVWAGIVDKIVWVHPHWSKQMNDSVDADVYVAVGQDNRTVSKDEKWVVNTTIPYWGGNSNMNISLFHDPRTFRYRVVSGEAIGAGLSLSDLGVRNDTPVILDIDLDYVSTRNPEFDRLAGILGEETANKVIRGFGLNEQLDHPVICMPNDPVERERQIAGTKQLWKSKAASLKNRIKQGRVQKREVIRAALECMAVLFCNQTRYDEGIDIFISALTTLPPKKFKEHSSPSGLMELIETMGSAAVVPHAPESAEPAAVNATLRELDSAIEALWGGPAARPLATTIARSVGDGFMPKQVWPEVETATLEIVSRRVGKHVPVYDTVRRLTPVPTFATEQDKAAFLADWSGKYEHQEIMSELAVQNLGIGSSDDDEGGGDTIEKAVERMLSGSRRRGGSDDSSSSSDESDESSSDEE